MTDEEKYPTYHDVIDAVIAQIKVDLAKEDETAIVELLARLPRKVLLSYLPEEKEDETKDLYAERLPRVVRGDIP